MINDDKKFLKEFLIDGALLGLVAMGMVALLTITLNGAANWLNSQPTPTNQRFEVVDKYDGRCNVVRYNPDGSARYSYFLYCNNTPPNNVK